MTKRIRVNINDDDVEGRYASKVKIAVDLIAPKNLALIGGRATAKTSDYMAERSMDIIYDMPGSYQVLVSDTYVNALKNVVPALFEGWRRKGWREGIHYITDKRPPSHFKLPYKPPLAFKHTISLFNGCFFNIGSLDQPSGLAGGSYQHMYGDEARLLKFEKLKRLTPAIRGEYERFSHSVYYRGRTFFTDMPNILSGDEDWIWNMQKEMDKEQAQLALQIGLELNKIKCELINYSKAGDHKKIKNLKRQVLKWKEYWIRARKELTFFYVVSSFVNADVLSEGFFFDNLKALGLEEFKSAILSFQVDIKKGEKFYGHLGEHHFMNDGINSAYYDKYKLGEEIQESSLALKYIDHNRPLDIGVDFGGMCSMVSGQHRGEYLYLLKEFFTLAPESSLQLANKFTEFYKDHKHKVVNMYYDRSGNQYQSINRDWASELKGFIEYKDGVSTGWVVNLISRNQSTIYQAEEYNFAKQLMGETHIGLPKLKIDKFGCKNLKSSLELTKILTKTDKKGSKTIHKDKSSEKLALHLLPMYSTNFSDAFKYFIFRPEFLKYTKKSNTTISGISVH
ncbi:MAG: hypothetical protein BM557_01285 [Flavobacterium sp. MedPE-SWcel]|uniref:hypothetical protein n=1 Tax=uncultured Flavobacterium sp. TaxID=165435 RepID=UPI000914C044|nr:hypothetical protein [uncultured Flavobacterium sp.]OIQ22040.1 MAG: hypothetical protein BM557_01285 [Flavobacterium sp. MedPE-SWcel]